MLRGRSGNNGLRVRIRAEHSEVDRDSAAAHGFEKIVVVLGMNRKLFLQTKIN